MASLRGPEIGGGGRLDDEVHGRGRAEAALPRATVTLPASAIPASRCGRRPGACPARPSPSVITVKREVEAPADEQRGEAGLRRRRWSWTFLTPSTSRRTSSTLTAAALASAGGAGRERLRDRQLSWPESPRRLVSSSGTRATVPPRTATATTRVTDRVVLGGRGPAGSRAAGRCAAWPPGPSRDLAAAAAGSASARRPGSAGTSTRAPGTIVSDDEQRGEQRDRHGDRERPEQLAGHAADQRDRQEDGDGGERRRR